MSITFKFPEYGKGDAIFVSFDGKNILIDGGMRYRNISNHLDEIIKRKEYLDLVVLTHIDSDHIGGLVEFLEKPKERKNIKEIWFNSFSTDEVYFSDEKISYKTSFSQGEKFEELAKKMKQENKDFCYKTYICVEDDVSHNLKNIDFTLLSPTQESLNKLYAEYKKEKKQYSFKTSGKNRKNSGSIEELASFAFEKDYSITNGSSIAFILKYKKKYNFLLLADAHIDLINKSLLKLGFSKKKKLEVEFVKLSHHGSKNNINKEFLDLIDTDTYIISTDGSHGHPDSETLSLIIKHHNSFNKNEKIYFYFNNKGVMKELLKTNTFNIETQNNFNYCFQHLNPKIGIDYL